MTASVVGIGTAVRGTSSTLTAVSPGHIAGDTLLLFTGEFVGSQVISAPAGWALMTRNNVAQQVTCFGFDAVGGDTIPPITWGSGSIAWAVLAVCRGMNPVASILDGIGDDRTATSSTTSITGPAAAYTPGTNGGIAWLFGSRNKSATANGTVFTAPAGFTIALQSAPNGATSAFCIGYQIQTTATAIAGNSSYSGSVADTAGQSMKGSLFVLKALAASVITPTRSLLGVGT